MSQALYRKYRPRSWSEVVGQPHVVQTLRNALSAERIVHAYLFAGPRGTGKTTVARILAKAVNCLSEDLAGRPCNACDNCQAVNENRFLDLIELDAASNNGVDDVRDLRDKIGFSPSQGRYKVYIIDEVHMLSTAAFNALLKTLEEPPPHAIFVLATTEISRIPATVLSRCQRHEFRRVAVDEILANLRKIVEAEGWQAEEEALRLIARQATGSIRDAQSLLDQLSSAGSSISLDTAQLVLGTATSEAVLELMDCIERRDTGAALETLRRALDAGADPRNLARQIVEYLRGLLLTKLGNARQVDVVEDVRKRMAAQAAAVSSTDVLRLMRAFNVAAADTRGGWQPSLSLELALASAFEEPAPSANAGVRSPGGPSTAPSSAGRAWPSASEAMRGNEPTLYQNASTAAGTTGPQPKADTVHVPHEDTDAADALASDSQSRAARVVGLTDVIKAWKDVKLALKPSHPGVEALLNSCKPVEVRGDELLIGFQSETVRGLMDKPENIKATREAIAEVLGADLRLALVVISARGKVPPNLPQDGMVAAALDHGGEIVDLQE